jgi:hypothetical protein
MSSILPLLVLLLPLAALALALADLACTAGPRYIPTALAPATAEQPVLTRRDPGAFLRSAPARPCVATAGM